MDQTIEDFPGSWGLGYNQQKQSSKIYRGFRGYLDYRQHNSGVGTHCTHGFAMTRRHFYWRGMGTYHL